VFISDEMCELLKLDGSHELAQPQSPEYRWLRTSTVPRLLTTARDNLRFTERAALFETGHVFDHIGTGRESTRLGLVLADRDASTELFYELKGAVSLLLERMNVGETVFDDTEPFPWDPAALNATLPGRRAVIRDGDGAVLGFIGAVHGRVAEALKLKGAAAVAELDLRALVVAAQQAREFEPLPKYPGVTRDISVLVPVDTKIDDILQVIQGAETGGLVADVDVFDIFTPTGREKLKAEGDTPEYPPERPSGRAGGKSVAFHILLRSDERTLTDKDADAAEAEIRRVLQEQLGARVR
jgi:phenylalanyl-tRNA synthetase beta chain